MSIQQHSSSSLARRIVTAVLAVVLLAQSMMTVADAHRLYQPQSGHLDAGHEHAFEFLAVADTPLPLDEHQHTHDDNGTDDLRHDHDHCCHCHGFLSLFLVPDLTLSALPVTTGNTSYGFPVKTPVPAALSRPPIA